MRFAAVLLVDPRGWVLLQERDEHPVIDPEKWGLVGGHLDGDEDFREGALRELVEETGIEVDPAQLVLARHLDIVHEAYGTQDQMAVFAAATDVTDDDVVLGEGRQIVFVDPAVAPTLPLTASASIVVPEFLASDLYDELRGRGPAKAQP